MLRVKKRDGKIVSFDTKKIASAIQKAFDSCKQVTDDQILDLLVLRVSADFQSQLNDDLVDVEAIQDSVERVLSLSGFTEVAKSYILYRKQRENVRRIETTTADYKNIVDTYLNESETEALRDQSSLYSVGGLILSNSGAITHNYWFSEVYDRAIEQAHQSGLIHIHDLDMLTGDSASWSLLTLIENGIRSTHGRISSRPAKHLMTLCNQMVNMLGILQNEWAGAQSLSHFDTLLAPYIKQDRLSHEEIKKALETFIYGLNIPSRWGSQAPFSNVIFDLEVPDAFKDQRARVGDVQVDFTYGDCQKEMDQLQDAFFEILKEGDAGQNGFSFPIPTILIRADRPLDLDRYRNLLLCAGKYGSPYFTLMKRSEPLSVDTWNQKPGFYSYHADSGSIGTVTINLPRIAWLSKDETDFFKRLEDVLILSCRSLQTKRQVLSKLLNEGLYPYTSQLLQDFSRHFSTIGIVGMNEAGINASWIGQDMSDERTRQLGLQVLSFMKEKLFEIQKQTGSLFNLEATPAESVSYRFARKDAELFPSIPTRNVLYYTNSTWLPSEMRDDLFDALDIQQRFHPLYNGGASFNIPLEKQITDAGAVGRLVNTIARSFTVSSFTLSPMISVCPEHGYVSGMHEKCPHCQKECTRWVRAAGYYQPFIKQNTERVEEFLHQKPFHIQ